VTGMNTSMQTVWVRGDLLVWCAGGADGRGCSGSGPCRASVFGRTMAADVDAALARLSAGSTAGMAGRGLPTVIDPARYRDAAGVGWDVSV
jgi:hypothetical protein